MKSRVLGIRPTLRRWTLPLCLTVGFGLPAQAQEPRAFAEMFLRWPETEREAETEEDEREEFIETYRNSSTFAPFTPGRGQMIVESAYSFISRGREGAKHSFPETAFRYGTSIALSYDLATPTRPGGPPRRQRVTSP